MNYLNETPGIYIFETTYNIGEINFYIVDDINNLSSSSDAEEDYEEIVVPTEEMTIEITEENPSKLFKATSQDDFVPVLNFFSSDGTESNLVMKILDEGKSELQTVDLNHIGIDGTNDVLGAFSFESEKIFYIEISAEDEVTTPQTCYFSITKSAEEDSTDPAEE